MTPAIPARPPAVAAAATAAAAAAANDVTAAAGACPLLSPSMAAPSGVGALHRARAALSRTGRRQGLGGSQLPEGRRRASPAHCYRCCRCRRRRRRWRRYRGPNPGSLAARRLRGPTVRSVSEGGRVGTRFCHLGGGYRGRLGRRDLCGRERRLLPPRHRPPVPCALVGEPGIIGKVAIAVVVVAVAVTVILMWAASAVDHVEVDVSAVNGTVALPRAALGEGRVRVNLERVWLRKLAHDL